MKLIKKNLKWITIIVLIVMIISFLLLKYFLLKQKDNIEKEAITVKEQSELLLIEEKQEPIKNIFVDIKGAVSQPGVYEIEENKKVIDVVQLAGGLTDQADTTLINLAKKVTNEMVIIIYTKDEVKKATEENNIAKIVDKQCICPEIKNDACINDNTKENETSSEATETKKINLNTATLEELQTLSGIGESKAKAIIEYRETVGNFQKIEDLMEVSGIGEALYEKVKNDITV
ncbi:MAG: helix-hairpin-helix domain-containing protein [Erysipelotrichaceae bacterium]|nr:helix-hairpin-helix domain-containing protein [Erysipelotrichaceae bacterium]